MTQTSKLLEVHRESVHPDWIDYNGHMNVAFYVLAFDHATDAVLEHLGMGERYRREVDCSVFTAEAHVTYDREVKLGDPLRFTTQLLDWDEKRVHYQHVMYHATEGYLAATNELLILHVDMVQRQVTPMPGAVQTRLAELQALHRELPRPPQVGRAMGIRRS